MRKNIKIKRTGRDKIKLQIKVEKYKEKDTGKGQLTTVERFAKIIVKGGGK